MKTTLLIHPQKMPLRGTITVPGDKSISHRAVLLGALAAGVSHIRNWLPAGDTLATLAAVRALGVHIEVDEVSAQAWDLRIEGRGLHGLQAPNGALNLRNAGTGLRLLAGIMVGQAFPSVLDGSVQLRKRPMRRITDPLTLMGADIRAENGRCPLHIGSASLHGIDYEMPVASAQVKSAVLLAGLYANESTRLFQPGPARDHTERMLTAMGVGVEVEGDWVILPAADGERILQPLDITVPGDISSAAFPLVAAALIPHSEVTVSNVGANETRTGILEMLEQMGARFSLKNERVTGGETAVDLTVHFDELHSADIGGEVVVRGIDEFPILTVAATQAAGTTTVRDAAELRVKEVDRISVLAGELRKLGVSINELPDGFTINGPLHLQGATVNSHDDHRLGMALAVAGLVAQSETRILDAACAHDSFPGFVETMQQLGANMRWICAESAECGARNVE